MITLSNHFSFEYMTASGAMGYNGRGWPHEQPLKWVGLLDVRLFTHVMKTVTLPPRIGNFKWQKPWDCIRFIWRDGKIVGTVNALGLTNPGFNQWVVNVGRKLDPTDVPVVGSIFGEPNEIEEMANRMDTLRVVAVEVNASCPNTKDDALTNTEKVIASCRAAKANTHHPIFLKLSVVHDIGKIVPAVEGMVEAFSINSVPWSIIFPLRKSPLAKYGGGGVSGKVVQKITWGFADRLKEITARPIIVPSVWKYDDIRFLRDNGFRAFSFGSVFLPFPWRPTLSVRRDIETRQNRQRRKPQ